MRTHTPEEKAAVLTAKNIYLRTDKKFKSGVFNGIRITMEHGLSTDRELEEKLKAAEAAELQRKKDLAEELKNSLALFLDGCSRLEFEDGEGSIILEDQNGELELSEK